MNLDLCNLNYLWTNAATTEKANNISYYSQDYVCLLTEVGGAETLTLNSSSASNCIKTLGSLRINQPRNTTNTFTLNLSDNISNIGNIVIGPSTATTINGPHNLITFNSINSSSCNLNFDKTRFRIYECSTRGPTTLINGTGIINTISCGASFNMNSGFLSNSKINAGSANLYNNCSLVSCDLRCTGDISINTNNIQDTFCAGNTISIVIDIYNLSMVAEESIVINSDSVNGGAVIGTGPETQVYINNTSLVTALEIDNIYSMLIKSDQENTIRGNYDIKQSLSIIGASIDDKAILTNSFSTNAVSTSLKNFVNYGTINSTVVSLSSGINYGIIKGSYINLDSVNNLGTIEKIE